MIFSNMDYAIPGVIIPFLILLLLFILAFSISRFLGKHGNSVSVIAVPIFVFAFLFFSGMVKFHSGFTYPIMATFQPNAARSITVGKIDAISSAPPLPLYYNRITGALEPAQLLTMNDEQYYVACSSIEEGQWVELTWATQERVVFQWKILQPDEKPAGTYPITPPNVDFNHTDWVTAGKIICLISGISFLLFVLLQYPVGFYISDYLIKMDRKQTDTIVPNRLGIAHACMSLCPILGILVGWRLTGFRGALLIALLGAIMIIRIVVLKQLTTMRYCGDHLLYKELRTERKLNIEDIASIDWRRSSIPHNRCLEILFTNGFVLRFEQESFWGLQDMYNRLNKRMKQKKAKVEDDPLS